MRLDKFLATCTELSRADAKKALHGGRVKIDGVVVKDGGVKVSADMAVSYDDQPLTLSGPRYIMLHKPADTLCSTIDEHYVSVLSLLDIERRGDLHIAGRLDADTTGLVLITDDGQWSHAITSPKRRCAKVYRVTLAEPLSTEAKAALETGVMLNGEEKPTLPAAVEMLAPTQLLLTICEGKYHQVKRMVAAVGNKVVALHRQQIGSVSLDPTLAEGEWRFLTQAEISALRG